MLGFRFTLTSLVAVLQLCFLTVDANFATPDDAADFFVAAYAKVQEMAEVAKRGSTHQLSPDVLGIVGSNVSHESDSASYNSSRAQAGFDSAHGTGSVGQEWAVQRRLEAVSEDYLHIQENADPVKLCPSFNISESTTSKYKLGYISVFPLITGDVLSKPSNAEARGVPGFSDLNWIFYPELGAATVYSTTPLPNVFAHNEYYKTAFQNILFSTTSDDTTPRTVYFTGTTAENVNVSMQIIQIDVSLTNDKPSMIGTEGTIVAYPVNFPAMKVADTFQVVDADNHSLVSAVVSIAVQYEYGVDFLAITDCPDAEGTTCEFDPNTASMTITGLHTHAVYEQAIRSITFFSSSQNPARPSRLVKIVLSDGDKETEHDGEQLYVTVAILSREVGFNMTVDPTASFSSELGERALMTIKLTAKPTAPLLCSVSTNDFTEATCTPNFVVFTESNWDSGELVTLTGKADMEVDGDITYLVFTTVMITQDSDYAKINPGEGSAVNRDDPINLVAIAAEVSSGAECVTAEDPAGAYCTLSLSVVNWYTGSISPFQQVTVTISSSNALEGVLESSTGLLGPTQVFVFDAQNYHLPQTVTVVGRDDFVIDPNSQYQLSFGATVQRQGFSGYMSILGNMMPPPINAVNTDDDVASVVASWGAGAESGTHETGQQYVCTTSENGGKSCTFFLKLGCQPTAGATLSIQVQVMPTPRAQAAAENCNSATSATTKPKCYEARVTTGSDTSNTLELVFDADSWNIPQEVEITGFDDGIKDETQFYQLQVGPVAVQSGADPNYSGDYSTKFQSFKLMSEGNGAKEGTASLQVRAGPESADSFLTTSENGLRSFFFVKLESTPAEGQVVTVDVSSSENKEMQPAMSLYASPVENVQLYFTTSNWGTEQMVVVVGIDDDVVDGTTEPRMTCVTSSGDPKWDGKQSSIRVKNFDDDGFEYVINDDATQTVCAVNETGTTCAVKFTVPESFPWCQANSNDQGTCQYQSIDVQVASQQLTEAVVAPTGFRVTKEGGQLIYRELVNGVPGSSSAGTGEFTVTGADDSVEDGIAKFNLTIDQTLTYVQESYMTVGSKTTKSFTIPVANADNDTASVAIELFQYDESLQAVKVQNATTREDDATVKPFITVRLTSQPGSQLILPITSSNPNEGVPEIDSLMFDESNWNELRTINIVGVDDQFDDADELYYIIIGPSVTEDVPFQGFEMQLPFLNIDDDTYGMVIQVEQMNSSEWGNEASFTMSLATQPQFPILFSISSQDATEGKAVTNLLVLAADNWKRGVQVMVRGEPDSEDDGDTHYTVQVSPMITKDLVYKQLQAVKVQLLNKDEPSNLAQLFFWPLSGQTDESGTSTVFNVEMRDWWSGGDDLDNLERPYEKVVVRAVVQAPGVGKAMEGRLAQASTVVGMGGVELTYAEVTFTPANWHEPKQFSIQGLDDKMDDGEQSYSVSLVAVVHTVDVVTPWPVLSYKMINANDTDHSGIDTLTVTNLDDDFAGADFTRDSAPSNPISTSEAGRSVELNLRLRSRPLHDVTFTTVVATITQEMCDGGNLIDGRSCTCGDSGNEVCPPEADIVEGESIIVYAQGDSWTKTHKVRVRGLDDFMSDGKMPFRVVCTAASLDTKYSSLNIPSIGLENEDNDNSQLNVYFSSILWTGESNGAQLQYRNPFPVDETGAKRYMYVNLPRAPACPETCTAAGACSAAAQGCQASVTVETWSDDTETGTINSNGFTFTTSNWNQNKYQVIEITGIDNDYVGCGPMRAIPCEKDCGVVVSKGEGTDRCNTDTDRDTMFQIRLTMESVDLFFDGVDTSFSVWNIDDELLQLSKSACTVAEYGSSCSFGIELQAWRFLNDLLSASDVQETSLMHSVVIHATSTNVLEGVIRPATDAIGTKIEDDGSITFVFTQDDWWVARNLTVTGVDDFVADGPQVFKVTVNSTITYKRGAGTALEDVSPGFRDAGIETHHRRQCDHHQLGRRPHRHHRRPAIRECRVLDRG
jgi:hypothetical protein